VLFASKNRKTLTIFGWRNEASVRDSSRNRERPHLNDSELDSDFGWTDWSSLRWARSPGRYSLIATLRLRFESVAR